MTTDTKKHIDSARQVLVGVVPNPTSQIDQITNALIYKFMDDMDQAAIKTGGDASFFVGDLERYAWTRLMDTRMGNQERMNLYSEALIKFSQAKQLPELFRGIFKSAFLPYRSPETLGLFLKEIDYFDYSHPEELGNAYEYLLSIMSSQGDAGQFRTPRHIIDFIVDVVNPTKNDKVLDPACGTGGFLVSSYKHILKQHDGIDDPEKKEKALTPEERKKLMANFDGYDIDPTMVRIAQVNMYLHQFKNPKIFQYDSLSSEERWNDKFDVILANPPFMSPKGGIKPHSKFSIPSSRSEVLFVDYIMNHLRPKGRAGIIVPEGIVFQQGNAYKQLRKNLVEDGLYAIVSLPSGIFNPYAGVKTSILLFDNNLSKQNKDMLFVKIENDGFDLGAQRRPIDKNDLPSAFTILTKWKTGEKVDSNIATYVEKKLIAENGEYNLSVDRYQIVADHTNTKWSTYKLKQLEESGDITLGRGQVISKKDLEADPGIYPVYSSSAQGNGEFGQYGKYMFDEELITWSVDGGGRFFWRPRHKFSVTNVSGWLRINSHEKIDCKYLFRILDSEWQKKSFDYVAKAHPSVIREMYDIPIPPLDVQKSIVEKLDNFQNIIDGGRLITKNWKTIIEINPKWKQVKLGDICNFENGKAHEEFIKQHGKYVVVNSKFIASSGVTRKYSDKFLSPLRINDVVMVMSDVPKGGALAKCFIVDKDETYTLNQRIGLFRPKDKNVLDSGFLYLQLNRNPYLLKYDNHQSQTNLRKNEILDCPFFIPDINEQKKIVNQVNDEKELVEASRRLIDIYEQKVKNEIALLWGKGQD